MQVTDTTKFADISAFVQYFDKSSIKELKSAAERKYGNPWNLALGDFFACSKADWSHIGASVNRLAELTVLQYYWMESYKDMCDAIGRAMARLTVSPTAEAKEASSRCRKMSFEESTLTFMRDYFNLHSFDAVYGLTINDLMLAKKDSYNKAVFEHTMAEIHKRKIQTK